MLRDILRSVIARGATFPLTALAVFCSTYLTIRYAGADGFASISLISSLFLLVIYADLGLGAAVINIVAESQDDAFRNAQVSTVVRLLFLPAGLLACLGVAGNSVFSWATLLGLKGLSAAEVDSTTMAVFLIFAAAVPLGLGQRILTGLKLNHIAVMLSSSSSLATLAITYVLIAAGVPFLWLSVGQAAGVLFAAAVCSVIGFRKLGLRFRSVLFGSWTPWRPLFSTAGPMIVVMVGLPIAFQSHRLVLAHTSSVSELAEYSLALQFYNPLWSFFSVAAMSLWPAFAENRARGGPADKFGNLFAILGGSAVIMGVGLVVLGQAVGLLLSQSRIALGPEILVAFSCLLFVQAVQQVPGMYFTSPKGLRFQAVCVSVMCVTSVCVSLVATTSLGSVGPVAATALAVGVCQVVPGLVKLPFARGTIDSGAIAGAQEALPR